MNSIQLFSALAASVIGSALFAGAFAALGASNAVLFAGLSAVA